MSLPSAPFFQILMLCADAGRTRNIAFKDMTGQADLSDQLAGATPEPEPERPSSAHLCMDCMGRSWWMRPLPLPSKVFVYDVVHHFPVDLPPFRGGRQGGDVAGSLHEKTMRGRSSGGS